MGRGRWSGPWTTGAWSKQTGVYFLIGSLAMLPIAYLAHWMEHSLRGILGYFLIYLAIFAGIWAIQYLTWRRRIGKLNQKTGIISLSSGRKRRLPPCLPAIVPQSAPGFHSPEEQPHREAGKKNPARSAHRAAGTA